MPMTRTRLLLALGLAALVMLGLVITGPVGTPPPAAPDHDPIAAGSIPPPAPPKDAILAYRPEFSPRPRRTAEERARALEALPQDIGIDPRAPAGTGALPLRMAGLIAQAGVPARRLEHFAWLADPAWVAVPPMECETVAWRGTIEEVTRVKGGHVVRVRISPLVTCGASTTVMDYFVEIYRVIGDRVEFLQGIDPPDAGPGVITD